MVALANYKQISIWQFPSKLHRSLMHINSFQPCKTGNNDNNKFEQIVHIHPNFGFTETTSDKVNQKEDTCANHRISPLFSSYVWMCSMVGPPNTQQVTLPNMYLYGPGWLSWSDSPSDNKTLTLGGFMKVTQTRVVTGRPWETHSLVQPECSDDRHLQVLSCFSVTSALHILNSILYKIW